MVVRYVFSYPVAKRMGSHYCDKLNNEVIIPPEEDPEDGESAIVVCVILLMKALEENLKVNNKWRMASCSYSAFGIR